MNCGGGEEGTEGGGGGSEGSGGAGGGDGAEGGDGGNGGGELPHRHTKEPGKPILVVQSSLVVSQ